MSKLPVLLGLLVLATLPLAVGCTSTSCQAILDGVYTVIGPDGGTVTMPADAGADAGTTDAAAAAVPATYVFHGGLPEYPQPGDTWSCDQPTMTCEMAYACTRGYQTAGIVTSFTPGQKLSFSVTFPGMTGTIVNLDPTPN